MQIICRRLVVTHGKMNGGDGTVAEHYNVGDESYGRKTNPHAELSERFIHSIGHRHTNRRNSLLASHGTNRDLAVGRRTFQTQIRIRNQGLIVARR